LSTLPGTTGRRRIFLMRHGHVDYFSKEVQRTRAFRDVPLTPLGRDQADAAGIALAHVPLDRAICSGYPRARETAEHVLAHQERAPKLEVEPDFSEIAGGSAGEVKNRMEIAAKLAFSFDTAHEPGARQLEGGEEFAAVLERSSRGIKKLLGEPGWSQLLIVAHEGVNRVMLSWMANAGLRAATAFDQDTACINVIDFDMVPAADGSLTPEIARMMLKSVNLTPYNYVKHGMNLTSLESIFARNPHEDATSF
jgi:broad specificity phosphatase PhoE